MTGLTPAAEMDISTAKDAGAIHASAFAEAISESALVAKNALPTTSTKIATKRILNIEDLNCPNYKINPN